MTESNEPKELRDRRRAASQWLTAQANDIAHARDPSLTLIRLEVLRALASLDQRLVQLNASLRDTFHLSRDVQLVRFYMKGGNAYDCLTNAVARQDLGGGASDWDTQVLIDPWAPPALQALALERVEDLVTDTMVKAGVAIADLQDMAVGTLLADIPERWAAVRGDLGRNRINMSSYTLSFDDPQSLRRVFDPQRVGLWTNDRRPLAAPQIDHPKWIPGILLNDAIRPFILYRMGYTWHAEPDPPGDWNIPAIVRPILMELIDVTVPRRGTIEAVGVWEQLARGTITVNPIDVTVHTGTSRQGASLPLPDLIYHVMEMATMLAEIADGSSQHADKLPKRFERVAAIWTNVADRRPDILRLLSTMAGVSDLSTAPLPEGPTVEQINARIRDLAGDQEALFMSDAQPYPLLRRLMYLVAARTAGADFDLNGRVTGPTLKDFDTARQDLFNELDSAVKALPAELNGPSELAFSDDLVLTRILEEEEYLSPSQVGFSGIRRAAVVRVTTPMHMDALANILRARWDRQDASGNRLSVEFRRYSVRRATGVTQEMTLVVFRNGAALAVVTLTTAQASEAPFHLDAHYPDRRMACLPEIAMQRKVAAALIEAYTVRKVLERQYDAIQSILPQG